MNGVFFTLQKGLPTQMNIQLHAEHIRGINGDAKLIKQMRGHKTRIKVFGIKS